MSPYCNIRHFMEALGEVPERLGWYWIAGSVGYNSGEDRYVFNPLVGPGLDVLMKGNHGRALLSLNNIVVDCSVVKCKNCKPNLILPREYNHVWTRLYGTCQVGYVIPKRIFLWISDQVISDYMNTFIYRRRTGIRVQV
jgi:hypothetical protein